MNYLQMLSLLGIGGAHPGGISLTKEIIENEKFPLNHTVLDIGCGTGQTCHYLDQLGYNVIGLDHDPVMIQHAKQRNIEYNSEILYLQEDLTTTSLLDQSVDVILSESMLNFTNLNQTLPEITRILRPNGVIIAIEMIRNKPLLKAEIDEITSFYGIPSILSTEEWKKEFMKYGLTMFKIQSEEDFSSFKTEEPSTEFHISDSTPPSVFHVLSKHEELTLKYSENISYRVFFARSSV